MPHDLNTIDRFLDDIGQRLRGFENASEDRPRSLPTSCDDEIEVRPSASPRLRLRSVNVRSRALDLHRTCTNARMAECAEAIAREIEAQEDRTRARSAKPAEEFRNAVSVLILDLYAAHRSDPDLEIGINLRSNSFKLTDRYRRVHLPYRQFKAAFEGLATLGYVNVIRRGHYDSDSGEGQTTRVRATTKLIELIEGQGSVEVHAFGRVADEETIVLRDVKKRNFDYAETEHTHEMRERLSFINSVLRRHEIDFEQAGHAALLELARQKNFDGYVDLTAKTLVRIFSNGSFEQGGRFYRGWWQGVPRSLRRYIRIDGEPVVEWDYKAMHPTMLYLEAGIPVTDDPYLKGVDARHRDLAKHAFNALINAPNKNIRQPEGYDAASVGMKWAAFLECVRNAHQPIAHRFHSCYGLTLQNKDARMAECILMAQIEKDVPCLPNHDSFIVQRQHSDELRELMARTAREILGSEIGVSLTWKSYKN